MLSVAQTRSVGWGVVEHVDRCGGIFLFYFTEHLFRKKKSRGLIHSCDIAWPESWSEWRERIERVLRVFKK